MSNARLDSLIQKYTVEGVVQKLSSCITQQRWERMKQVSLHRLEDLCIAVEGIWDIHNALAIVRSAEAIGIDSVGLVDCDYKRGHGKQTMRGADSWMSVTEYDTFDEFLADMKTAGWKLAGACPRGSMLLEQVPCNEKICLLLGNEHRGLSEKARQACDYLYRIPMYGMVESMNLSVAGAISLYDIARRKRDNLVQNPAAGYERRLARFLISSMGFDRAKMILERDHQLFSGLSN